MKGTIEGADLDEIYKTTMSDTDDNLVFTATSIAADHPGLAGRGLTPMGKITEQMLE